MRKLLPILCVLAFLGCDKPGSAAVVAQAGTPSQTVAAATTTVTHIDTQLHGYSQAPAWFVRVKYATTSTLPHIVIETTALYNGVVYGNVRAIDPAVCDYDVFYDGTAPSGRQVRVYPAEVVGASWHNGKCWVDYNPFPPGVVVWHLDISWPDIYLHPRGGWIAQSDQSAAVTWGIDVQPVSQTQSLVTVSIP